MAKEYKFLFFDTELSGYDQLVSLGYVLTNGEGEELEEGYYLLRPNRPIRRSTVAIHGITTEEARKDGVGLSRVLTRFTNVVKRADVILCYAAFGDLLCMGISYEHLRRPFPLDKGSAVVIDVAFMAEKYMKEHGLTKPGETPGLDAVYAALFPGEDYDRHNSLADARATAKCFWRLLGDGYLTIKSIFSQARVMEICHQRDRKEKENENN
ncbi:MAG: 3'-5' exonuclease [Bacteroidales bacterium]|nr:3'-5' exonuclease [Bacteroidales bacterium]